MRVHFEASQMMSFKLGKSHRDTGIEKCTGKTNWKVFPVSVNAQQVFKNRVSIRFKPTMLTVRGHVFWKKTIFTLY